jgi:hypothetical protein
MLWILWFLHCDGIFGRHSMALCLSKLFSPDAVLKRVAAVKKQLDQL